MNQPPRHAKSRLAYNQTFQRVFSGLHTFWYRLTGGRAGGRFGKSPVLILTTLGRKTGKPRSTPLFYLPANGGYAVVASNGGSDAAPMWWLNLRSNPDARITVGNKTISVRARDAAPAEREQLWPQLVAMYSGYATYETRTARKIPVVLLVPLEGDSSES